MSRARSAGLPYRSVRSLRRALSGIHSSSLRSSAASAPRLGPPAPRDRAGFLLAQLRQPRARLGRVRLADRPHQPVVSAAAQRPRLKRRAARQQFVQHGPERVHIAPRVHVPGPHLRLLRAHVLRRADHLPRLGEDRLLRQRVRDRLGHPEVDHLRHRRLLAQHHQNVARLEVPVDDPLLVRVLHRLADRDEQLQPLPDRQPLPVAVVRHGQARHVLHHEVRPPPRRRPRVVHAGHVRMVHERERLPLLLEPRDHLARVHPRLDDLDRHPLRRTAPAAPPATPSRTRPRPGISAADTGRSSRRAAPQTPAPPTPPPAPKRAAWNAMPLGGRRHGPCAQCTSFRAQNARPKPARSGYPDAPRRAAFPAPFSTPGHDRSPKIRAATCGPKLGGGGSQLRRASPLSPRPSISLSNAHHETPANLGRPLRRRRALRGGRRSRRRHGHRTRRPKLVLRLQRHRHDARRAFHRGLRRVLRVHLFPIPLEPKHGLPGRSGHRPQPERLRNECRRQHDRRHARRQSRLCRRAPIHLARRPRHDQPRPTPPAAPMPGPAASAATAQLSSAMATPPPGASRGSGRRAPATSRSPRPPAIPPHTWRPRESTLPAMSSWDTPPTMSERRGQSAGRSKASRSVRCRAIPTACRTTAARPFSRA